MIYVAEVKLQEKLGRPFNKAVKVCRVINIVSKVRPTYDKFVERAIGAVHDAFCEKVAELYGEDIVVELEYSKVTVLNVLENAFAEPELEETEDTEG